MAKFCSSCGQEVSENTQFCGNCGASVNGNNSNNANMNQGYQQNMNQNYQQANQNPNAKSKLVAGLLGLFLGAWGIHNFYLGRAGRGVAQIFVTIFTCGIGSLWGFIEGILILCGNINTDANGNPLRD